MHYRTVLNPDTDDDFAHDVNTLATPDLQEPGQLENALRDSYPKATVRNGVAESDGRIRWYVYRDGHWIEPDRNI